MARTVVVGTAGHVDHGKSSLVKALTGTDPDRLKEEKERGITIDLGFAHAAERDGIVLSFVDVPGHERFVRNMLAGAAGIDVVLLVVAADESVMPQTREHLDVCRLLGVPGGVVALSKCDLADDDTREIARLEVVDLVAGTFLAGAPIVPCSVTTGEGLDRLVSELIDVARRSPERQSTGPFRMPIDRAFTLKGFGTVATGTSLAGRLATGDEIEILPTGLKGRVRGIQVHGSGAETAGAGRRVAVNIGGIDHHELRRGDVVVSPRSHVAASVLDAHVTLLPDAPEIRDLGRVRLHLGTAEVMARIRWAGPPPGPGESAPAQLRLESPVVAAIGDRFILRRYSPVATIGGGRVVDAMPRRKLRPSDAALKADIAHRAALLEAGRWEDLILRIVDESGPRGISETDLAADAGCDREKIRAALAAAEGSTLVRVAESPRRWVAASVLAAALDGLRVRLAAFHKAQPLIPGHPKQALRDATGLDDESFAALLAVGQERGLLTLTRDLVSLAGHVVTLSTEEAAARDLLLATHESAGLSPPDLPPLLAQIGLDRTRLQRLVRLLQQSGELVKLKDGMMLHGGVMARLLADMASWYAPGQSFSVPDFKERSGTSRKHAIPLLECLDALGHTRRQGDGRIWIGRPPAGSP